MSVCAVSSLIVPFSLSSSLPSSEEYKLINNKQSLEEGRSNDQVFSLVGEVAFQPLKYQPPTPTAEPGDSAPAFCPSYCIYCLSLYKFVYFISSFTYSLYYINS